MFTTYPNNFQSFYAELKYHFSTEQEGDITLYVTDSTGDLTYGVKRFYSTSTAEINVAPILRGYAIPPYSISQSGFVDTAGALNVCVSDQVPGSEVSAIQSEQRIFTLSKSDESERGVLTTLPTQCRAISLGEGEILSFRVDPNYAVSVVERQYLFGSEELFASRSYECDEELSGLARFAFVAERIESDEASDEASELSDTPLDRIILEVSQAGEVIAEVEYCVIDEPLESLRVAWVSSRGGIEHYTFPVVVTTSVDSYCERSVTLRSAFESYDIRKALVEIVESPKVWVIEEGEAYEAELGSSSMELSPRAELAAVELMVKY